MKKTIIKSTFDGFLHASVLFLLSAFTVLPVTKEFALKKFFIIAGVVAIILAASSFLLFRKEKTIKSILLGAGVGFISSVIFSLIILLIQIEFPVVTGDIWYGEGITIMLISKFFIVISFILKFCVFLGLFIRNTYHVVKLKSEDMPE